MHIDGGTYPKQASRPNPVPQGDEIATDHPKVRVDGYHDPNIAHVRHPGDSNHSFDIANEEHLQASHDSPDQAEGYKLFEVKRTYQIETIDRHLKHQTSQNHTTYGSSVPMGLR